MTLVEPRVHRLASCNQRALFFTLSFESCSSVHCATSVYCFVRYCLNYVRATSDDARAGVIFYEMLYGKRPFHGNASQSSIASGCLLLGATDLQFDAKPHVSQEAKDFLRR